MLDEGYQEGFDYHQQLYAEDPQIQAWVNKSDYF